jgi:hypothetical protein
MLLQELVQRVEVVPIIQLQVVGHLLEVVIKIQLQVFVQQYQVDIVTTQQVAKQL